jgi:hypothetical protein
MFFIKYDNLSYNISVYIKSELVDNVIFMLHMRYYRKPVDILFNRSESWLPNEMLFLNKITQATHEDNAENDRNDFDENKSACPSYVQMCFSVLLPHYFCIIFVFLLL